MHIICESCGLPQPASSAPSRPQFANGREAQVRQTETVSHPKPSLRAPCQHIASARAPRPIAASPEDGGRGHRKMWPCRLRVALTPAPRNANGKLGQVEPALRRPTSQPERAADMPPSPLTPRAAWAYTCGNLPCNIFCSNPPVRPDVPPAAGGGMDGRLGFLPAKSDRCRVTRVRIYAHGPRRGLRVCCNLGPDKRYGGASSRGSTSSTHGPGRGPGLV